MSKNLSYFKALINLNEDKKLNSDSSEPVYMLGPNPTEPV